jgi:hypothetical protein
MTGVYIEVCRCLLPSDTAQKDPDALVEIEDKGPDVVPMPIWLQLLEVEAAVLLDESG